MDARIGDILKRGEKLFSERAPLVSQWQKFAENFYRERADFHFSNILGCNLTSELTTSYPMLVRREMCDSLGAYLRPTNLEWFYMAAPEGLRENESKIWLENAARTMRNAMYDVDSGFTRATKEADHDYGTFGNAAISVEYDAYYNRLLYRCWHLRDIVWCEGHNKKINDIYHKIKMSVREINSLFNGNISDRLKQMLAKNPTQEAEIMRAILDARYFEGSDKKVKTPYVSIYFEIEGGHILEEKPSWTQVYVIPRWQTVSGSQYAYSPAMVAAYPDARMLQDMMLVLLEAGEKAVHPAVAVTGDVIRGDYNDYRGGITYLDPDYDQRTGDAIQVLPMGANIPIGLELLDRTRESLAAAFYLNKLKLPQAMSGTTALEFSQRMQEYIRDALPLFEPMEAEYNGALCNMTFEIMLRNNAFDEIPEELAGREVPFKFISPLHEAIDKQKAMIFQQARGVVAETMALDPKAGNMLNAAAALTDTLDAIGVPAAWMYDDDEIESMNAQQEQMAAAQQQMQMMQQGAEAGKTIGEAGQALRGGM